MQHSHTLPKVIRFIFQCVPRSTPEVVPGLRFKALEVLSTRTRVMQVKLEVGKI